MKKVIKLTMIALVAAAMAIALIACGGGDGRNLDGAPVGSFPLVRVSQTSAAGEIVTNYGDVGFGVFDANMTFTATGRVTLAGTSFMTLTGTFDFSMDGNTVNIEFTSSQVGHQAWTFVYQGGNVTASFEALGMTTVYTFGTLPATQTPAPTATAIIEFLEDRGYEAEDITELMELMGEEIPGLVSYIMGANEEDMSFAIVMIMESPEAVATFIDDEWECPDCDGIDLCIECEMADILEEHMVIVISGSVIFMGMADTATAFIAQFGGTIFGA